MNFGFSEEQDLLRQEVRKFLDQQGPLPEVRRIIETAEGYAPEQWSQLGELGFLGLIVPEKYGGAGLGWVDLVVLLEETGRSLYPSPLLSTILAGATLVDVGSEEQKQRWLPGLAWLKSCSWPSYSCRPAPIAALGLCSKYSSINVSRKSAHGICWLAGPAKLATSFLSPAGSQAPKVARIKMTNK